MAQSNVVPAGDSFQFKGRDLHGYLVSASDSRKTSVAVHRFLKRDGAKVEVMGREPHRLQASLVFVGPAFRSQATAFVAEVEDDPSGVLVHPVFGRLRVVCEGVERAQLDVVNASNAVTLDCSFVEDNVDLRLTAQSAEEGVSALQQSTQAKLAALAALVADYVAWGVALAGLQASVTSYAIAAAESALYSVANPRLPSLLEATALSAAALVRTIEEDAATLGDAATWAPLAAVHEVYAACLELDAAVRVVRARTEVYVVPALTTVYALAQRFGVYGLGRVDEILAANPQIENPMAIPAGTRILLAEGTL